MRNIKPVHAYEILDCIAAEKDEGKRKTLLLEFGDKAPLNALMTLNFMNNVELDLPSGMPPMDPKDMDAHTHPDFQGLLGANIMRIRNCTVQSNLKKFKKEQIFYELLINCPLKDAEILCAAKDKALEELYPTFTREFIASVFPAYKVEEK